MGRREKRKEARLTPKVTAEMDKREEVYRLYYNKFIEWLFFSPHSYDVCLKTLNEHWSKECAIMNKKFKHIKADPKTFYNDLKPLETLKS